MKSHLKVVAASTFILLFVQFSLGQTGLTITQGISEDDLIVAIQNELGLTPFNIEQIGDVNQFGLFSANESGVEIPTGLIIATGDCDLAIGPNDSGSSTTGGGNFGFGDPDLDELSTFTTNDAAILEFDFVATTDNFSIDFVFASEEYNEYVCGSVNDAFAIFLSGPGIAGGFSNSAINIAVIPGTNTPVSINTVNLGVVGSNGFEPNCEQSDPNWANHVEYFIDNSINSNPNATQFDGLTVPITATHPLNIGDTYHLKIAIADAGDTAFDSGAFLHSNMEVMSFGCGDSLACNYDANVLNVPDSCSYPGCMDDLACNFDAQAECDSGECIYPIGSASVYCGPGTIWDEATSSCIPDPIICGEGTLWSPILAQCIPAQSCPEDINGDGAVVISDLLALLGMFGSSCPSNSGCINELANNFDPNALVDDGSCDFSPPQCNGISTISYNGHAYGLTGIGDQCWFAENLRTTMYRNGDSISGGLSGEEWSAVNYGAYCVYGDGNAPCDPPICDSTNYLNLYGRLYNWYTIHDSRGICPTGWHVPSFDDWTELATAAGGASIAGTLLKSSPEDNPSWTGTNTYGWNGSGGGYCYGGPATSAHYGSIDFEGFYWVNTSSENETKFTYLTSSNDDIQIGGTAYPNFGFTIRCLKDLE